MIADSLSFDIATAEDWPEIWPIFREVVAGADTYMYPPDMPEDAARASWMLLDSERAATFVARLDGAVVGTAFLRPNTIGLGDHVANAGWMVAASARGRGVGRRFAEHVIDHARMLGFHAMQFNAVISTNAGAIALWRSLGFEIVGTVPEAFRHRTAGLVPIHIMYRRI